MGKKYFSSSKTPEASVPGAVKPLKYIIHSVKSALMK
jgi:hypothetical protein